MSNDKYIIDFNEWIDELKLNYLPKAEAFRICLLYLFHTNMYQMGETSHEWSKEGSQLLDAYIDKVCEWKGQYRRK